MNQTPGHLYGPPVPHIAFYYGDNYLGEVRGHPSNVRAAELKLMEQTEMLYPGPEASSRRLKIVNASGVRLFCGDINIDLLKSPYRPSADEKLRRQGYWKTRDGDEGLVYILTVVYDPVRGQVVGLQKLRGPDFLIGKLTFPGGKLEKGESPEEAASREMKEETGLAIPVDAWKFVCRSGVVMVLAAESTDVLAARTCEDEPIFVMSAVRQLTYAKTSPELYSPDFILTLTEALKALGHVIDEESLQ